MDLVPGLSGLITSNALVTNSRYLTAGMEPSAEVIAPMTKMCPLSVCTLRASEMVSDKNILFSYLNN